MKNTRLNDLVEARLSRREAIKRLAKASAASAALSVPFASLSACAADTHEKSTSQATLTFHEIEHHYDETHHVAEGYDASVLISWGDVLLGDPSPFDPGTLTAESQSLRFGYNNDFVAYLPLPLGSNNSDHGLLCVNHEFPSADLMFPGYRSRREAAPKMTQAQAEIEQQAVGFSILEIKREQDGWEVVDDSPYARRISATTPMTLSGPVAGHRRVQTSADPQGVTPIGTLGNCAGGMTPWGTVLTGEELFADFFWGDATELPPEERRSLGTYGGGGIGLNDAYGAIASAQQRTLYSWYRFDKRFDVAHEPRESNRFGYLVEIDPYDPASVPKKRSALGRFKHEGASIVARDGESVVVYSGDDDMDNCVYKFVSRDTYNAEDRTSNLDILDNGDLYAAQFNADGSGRWLKLELGENGLTQAATGLADQTEVLLEARRMARLAGATPMDRPEDIDTDPVTGRVFVALTRNDQRAATQVEPANPRAQDRSGHIVEILPPGGDGNRNHTAEEFEWDVLLLGGDPAHPDADKRGSYHDAISASGWLANPDNLAFDPLGRLWIATDGLPGTRSADGDHTPIHDGLWATEITGSDRALTRHFFGCPRGAEMCGPCFTPNGQTLFVAVQHPGADWPRTFDEPTTRWPDFDENLPPRPAIVAITKRGGGMIGS